MAEVLVHVTVSTRDRHILWRLLYHLQLPFTLLTSKQAADCRPDEYEHRQPRRRPQDCSCLEQRHVVRKRTASPLESPQSWCFKFAGLMSLGENKFK